MGHENDKHMMPGANVAAEYQYLREEQERLFQPEKRFNRDAPTKRHTLEKDNEGRLIPTLASLSSWRHI